MWQNGINWMDDDEDQDSDTDSKLSGSAIVDSVMKQLRSHGHRKGHFEFSDPLNHQIREQDEEEEERELGGVAHSSSNGYRDITGASASHIRQGIPPHQLPGSSGRNAPSSSSSSKHYYPVGGQSSSGVRKDILSPVPEMSHSGARVVDVTFGPPMSPSSVLSSTVTGQGGGPRSGISSSQGGQRNWPSSVGALGTRSMDALHHTPPQPRREAPPYRPPPMDGVNSRSQEAILPPHSPPSHSSYLHDETASEVHSTASYPMRPRLGSHGNSVLTGTSHAAGGGGGGRGFGVSSQFYSGKSPSHVSGSHSGMTSPSHGVSQYAGSHSRAPNSSRTPPIKRANYERSDGHAPRQTVSAHNTPHHHSSTADHAPSSRPNAGRSREPNLNDVVDFLSSGDAGLVANAASYLQHLAYGDDSMKAKIRQFGAIPSLISLLRNRDPKVVLPVLGALRNLSFGRINDENKLMIVREHGLEELVLALRMSQMAEVRELITSVIWNISSCDEVKMDIVQSCVPDLVEFALIPYSGWNWEVAREPLGKPTVAVKWSVELRNITGILKNVSSAGEPSRVYLRQVNGLVDSLLWLNKAAVQHRQSADDKTVENVVCVLRNLSYQLENEVDLQDGSEDVLDQAWEAEQRRELDEVAGRNRPKKSSTPGCLSMCTRPKTSDSARQSSPPIGSAPAEPRRLPYVSRPSMIVDFANPDASVFPKRNRQVQGAALLWQPEVVFPYLATLEHYTGCPDTLEAAAGAIQNITACSWKWAVYVRNMIRACSGLRVIADLLNNGHDAVVRAGGTALRNLATDPRNKASLGSLVIPAVVPRLPFGSNHLGISESTTVALLVLLMEICANSPENAKLFREKEGVPYLTRLTRSRQHTTKIVFAANKICSILHTYKECKAPLKRDGWELSTYLRMQREYSGQFEFESAGSGRDRRGTTKGSKKRSTARENKKKRTTARGGREEVEGEGGVAGEGPPPAGVNNLAVPPPSSSPARSVSPQEPGYQTIATATAAGRLQPSSAGQQQQQQQPTVTTIYQTIAEVGNTSRTASPLPPPPPTSSSSPSHGATTTDQHQPSEAGEGGREGGNSTSPPLVPDDIVPDPNATYAAVEQIKERKRSSRREKERQQLKLEQEQQQQQQQEPPPPLLEEPSDSWV